MSQRVPNQGGYPPPQGPYVQQQPQTGYTGNGNGNDFAAQASRFNRDHIASPETKEFYKTSEFALWGVGVLLIMIVSAIVPDRIDVTRAWTLITYLSIAYLVSRGLSKAGTHRADWNYSAGASGQGLPAQITDQVKTPETKEFFKTSEFVVFGLTLFGLFVASVTSEFMDANASSRLMTFLTAGYIVSRGLSKIGTRTDHDVGRGIESTDARGSYTSGPGMMVPAAPAPVAQAQAPAPAPSTDTVDLRSPAQPVGPSGQVPPQHQGL